MNEFLHDALMLGRNKDTAMEEYLSAVGEKRTAELRAEENLIKMSDVMEDQEGVIHLVLDRDGYLEIECISSDEALVFEKVVTTDRFENCRFEFKFTVVASCLHNGNNYASITFRTARQEITVAIEIDNRIMTFAENDSQKMLSVRVTKDYLDFRRGKFGIAVWLERTESLLENINGSQVLDIFLMLYKAQVYIAASRFEDAKNLIEFSGTQLVKLSEPVYELTGYFIYLTSLYEMDEGKTEDAAKQIADTYAEHPSWPLLWMLFYMDSRYSENPAEKIKAIKKEYYERGCTSPIIYYEAVEAFRNKPELINNVSEFELSVLHFACKYDCLSFAMVQRLAEQTGTISDEDLKSRNIAKAAEILRSAYDASDSNIILKALVRIYVLMDGRSETHHRYYGKALSEFLEVPGIYKYYIFSANQKRPERLPDSVMRYFYGKEEILGEYRAYFLACIVATKKEEAEVYKRYYDRIGRFSSGCINEGKAGYVYSILYRDLFETKRLNENLCGKLYEILCVNEIKVAEKQIASVLVFHKEFKDYQEVFLRDGKADIHIYSPDALILFKGESGNVYCNLKHEIKPYMDDDEVKAICRKLAPVSRYMLISNTAEKARLERSPYDIMQFMFDNFGNGIFQKSYEQELLKNLIVFYSSNSDDEKLWQYMLSFLQFNLDVGTRAKLVEVMIEHKLYGNAYDEISKNGFDGVNVHSITALAHILAELNGYESEEPLGQMCLYSFYDDIFDPEVFQYMLRNYDGDMDVLTKMYFVGKAYNYFDFSISERILKKACSDHIYNEDTERVFSEYYKKGEDRQLVIDYLNCMAEMYLYAGEAESCFQYIEQELLSKTKFAEKTETAFLIFMRNRQIEGKTLKLIREMIITFAGKGICLQEFKDYENYFTLPGSLANICIAECIRKNDDTVRDEIITKDNIFRGMPVITYEINRNGIKENGSENMKEVIEGCFVRYFTLFLGDSVTYSIDGGEERTETYDDLSVVDDGSRFACLDKMIKMKAAGQVDEFNAAAKDYYIKNILINKLF